MTPNDKSGCRKDLKKEREREREREREKGKTRVIPIERESILGTDEYSELLDYLTGIYTRNE